MVVALLDGHDLLNVPSLLSDLPVGRGLLTVRHLVKRDAPWPCLVMAVALGEDRGLLNVPVLEIV